MAEEGNGSPMAAADGLGSVRGGGDGGCSPRLGVAGREAELAAFDPWATAKARPRVRIRLRPNRIAPLKAKLPISSLASTVVITELDSDGQPISSKEVGGKAATAGAAPPDSAAGIKAGLADREATTEKPKRKFATLMGRPKSQLFGQLRAYREWRSRLERRLSRSGSPTGVKAARRRMTAKTSLRESPAREDPLSSAGKKKRW